MSAMKYSLGFTAVFFAFGVFTGCKSTDSGSGAGGSVYEGTGVNDPWYYGEYYDRGDIIVTPPPGQPESPAHPEQPIYRPPAPRPTPLPSIPSAPRPMPMPAMRR
jgi:hypothetical protein